MGNENKPPPKKMSLEDSLIEMKMQSKMLERSAKKAEKESEKYRKKAKDALKKNEEEGAKMYLMSAASKHNECTFDITKFSQRKESP
jgi:charged multivesicular body protein 1